MVAQPRRGLLSEEEYNLLTRERTPSHVDDDRDELVNQLQERWSKTLTDVRSLYLYLTDEELAGLFGASDDVDKRSIRSSAQYLLAFLYLGLQATDDDVEFRLSSAIEQAEASQEQRATVQVDIITEPLLPPTRRLEAIKDGDFDRVSFEGLDQLFFDDRISPEELVEVLSVLGEEELSPDELREGREAIASLERPPTTVVVDLKPGGESDPDNDFSSNGYTAER